MNYLYVNYYYLSRAEQIEWLASKGAETLKQTLKQEKYFYEAEVGSYLAWPASARSITRRNAKRSPPLLS
ncbi:MAG: hypothetical protein AABN34_15765 [Acidobacteriota bacterium]